MKRNREHRPGLIPPPERIPLHETNTRGRTIALIVLAVIAVVAFGVGIHACVSSEAGWQQIDAAVSQTTAATELTLRYELGSGQLSATAENKRLTALYSTLADTAHGLFSGEAVDGVQNLAYLNAHPNETVTVPQALYDAFAMLERLGSRYLYYAPVYAQYEALYACTADAETVDFDPAQNEVLAEFVQQAAEFAADPDSVQLSLLGNCQVRLAVSDAYADFAAREGVTRYLDFFWLKNAFVVDYIADALVEAGYTNGILASYDGFSRNFAAGSFRLPFYDRVDGVLYPAAELEVAGSAAVVYLSDYPTHAMDTLHYYVFADGSIVPPFFDAAGQPQTAASDLAAYSRTSGCAETAVRALNAYTAETLDSSALKELAADGVFTVSCEARVVRCTDPGVTVLAVLDKSGVTYRVEEIG